MAHWWLRVRKGAKQMAWIRTISAPHQETMGVPPALIGAIRRDTTRAGTSPRAG